MHARVWWKMNRSSSEACAFKFDSNLDGRNFLVKSLRTSQRVFPYPCLSPFPRLAVPPYTHRPFHLSFLWGRFRLPRLTWMHLSGYSRPSFVSFWTGTMPSLLLSFSPCQFIPLFLPPLALLFLSYEERDALLVKPPLPEIIPYFFHLVYLQNFFFIILYRRENPWSIRGNRYHVESASLKFPERLFESC